MEVEGPIVPEGTLYNPFCYDADDTRLQKYLLLALVVAGKVARIQQEKLAQLFRYMESVVSTYHADQKKDWSKEPPFQLFKAYYKFTHQLWNLRSPQEAMSYALKEVKMGQYNRLSRAFAMLMENKIDLRTCPPEDLEKIPGLGMKTSRFFILFSRRNPGVACLDVHILAYMREKELAPYVPRSTPTSRRLYLSLQHVFLAHAQALAIAPADLDFAIWLARNRGDKIKMKGGLDADLKEKSQSPKAANQRTRGTQNPRPRRPDAKVAR